MTEARPHEPEDDMPLAELDARATSEIESGKSTENIKRYKETGVRDRNQERRLAEVRRLGDELYATSPWGSKPNKSTELWEEFAKCKTVTEERRLEKRWRDDKTTWGFEGQLEQMERDLRGTNRKRHCILARSRYVSRFPFEIDLVASKADRRCRSFKASHSLKTRAKTSFTSVLSGYSNTSGSIP